MSEATYAGYKNSMSEKGRARGRASVTPATSHASPCCKALTSPACRACGCASPSRARFWSMPCKENNMVLAVPSLTARTLGQTHTYLLLEGTLSSTACLKPSGTVMLNKLKSGTAANTCSRIRLRTRSKGAKVSGCTMVRVLPQA